MYYSYVEIEYVAMGFSPARTDLALKLLRCQAGAVKDCNDGNEGNVVGKGELRVLAAF
jgi:hypothetical protein